MASDASQKLRAALEFGVVVSIIMALMTLAARNIETYVIRSQIVAAFLMTPTVRGDMVTFRAEKGQWPSTEAELYNSTLSRESDLTRVVDHFELGDGGAITAVFDEINSAASLRGRRLTLRPLIASPDVGAPVPWVCASHRVPEGLQPGGIDETNIDPSQLPSACRKY